MRRLTRTFRGGDEQLLFPEQWVAVFLAFQSQAWHTDDLTGHRLPGVSPGLPGTPPVDLGGGDGIAGDGRIRIVAAAVNPMGNDVGLEKVTLLNTTPEPIELQGWMISDKNKQKTTLQSHLLQPGAMALEHLSGDDVQLGNKGGIISLLDPDGRKVHGVSYTRQQAARQGWTIVF